MPLGLVVYRPAKSVAGWCCSECAVLRQHPDLLHRVEDFTVPVHRHAIGGVESAAQDVDRAVEDDRVLPARCPRRQQGRRNRQGHCKRRPPMRQPDGTARQALASRDGGTDGRRQRGRQRGGLRGRQQGTEGHRVSPGRVIGNRRKTGPGPTADRVCALRRRDRRTAMRSDLLLVF